MRGPQGRGGALGLFVMKISNALERHCVVANDKMLTTDARRSDVMMSQSSSDRHEYNNVASRGAT
jgi:hypothetical protein